ncbi:MAG: M20 family metallopeptidase [Dehalococcoidales bacterium]|jgi:amidohydrolase
MNTAELKAGIARDIDARATQLSELSRNIHDTPETAMKERQACGWLTEYLQANGFTVETGICKLSTAFRGSYGRGTPAIAFLAEYDALPKLGHACGHNLIATSAIAAGVGAKRVVDELGGSIIVYGTPGEEGDAGKAIMAERGAFKDLDAAMITHPGGGHQVLLGALACQTLEVEFIGKAAHAAADPEAGVNALEAMILSFNAVNALRQHMRRTARVHGIITDGGDAANIVPAHTAATFLVRAVDDEYLDILREKVLNCFAGAAAATGAELKYRWAGVRYAAMRNNMTLARLFKNNMESLGQPIPLGDTAESTGSSDVGNVSNLTPTIQPMVAIAPADISLHTPRFAEIAATPEAFATMLGAAKAMAMTAADLLADPEALAAARVELQKSL